MAALALVGLGSYASTAAPATTTTTVASAARATTTTVPSTSTTAVAVTTTVPVPAFCPLAVGYLEDLRRITTSLADPAQLQKLVQHASPAIAQSGAGAPPEIKADVALLVSTIAQYVTALDAADYQLAKLSPDMVIELQTPAVQQAINHIDSYVRKTCAPS